MHPRMRLRELSCQMSGIAARLFLYLVGRSNEQGSAWPSAGTMADELKLSLRSVRVGLSELRSLSLFQETPGPNGTVIRTFGTDWLTALPPLQPAAPPCSILQPPPAAGCSPPLQPAAPKVEFHGSGVPRKVCTVDPVRDIGEEPAALPPPTPPSAPGVRPILSVVPDAKPKVKPKKARVFTPQAHEFVQAFREGYLEHVDPEYSFKPVKVADSHGELAEAQAWLREPAWPESRIQDLLEWLVTAKEAPREGSTWRGWAYEIRSVRTFREKREKLEQKMRLSQQGRRR